MNKYALIGRLAADVLMVFLIAWSSSWSVIILAVACACIFAPYYEIVIWGLAFDSLYGLHSMYGIITSLILFIAIEIVKEKTRI